MDYDGDRQPEWWASIDREGFQRMQWEVALGPDERIDAGTSRLVLRKEGEGRAFLAQLRVSTECLSYD